MKKFKCVLSSISIVLLGFMIQLVVGGILGVIIGFKETFHTLRVAQGDTTALADIADTVTQIIGSSMEGILFITLFISTIIFGLLYFKKYARKYQPEFKLVFTPLNCISIVVIGCMLQCAISMILLNVLPLFPTKMNEYDELISNIKLRGGIISFLSVGILAPICEECMFRGIIMKKLELHFSFLVANIIQATFFGIYHMNLIQGLYAFVLGLAMGALYIKFKTILPGILLHATVNILGLYLDKILPKRITYSLTYSIGFGVLCGAIAIIVLYRMKSIPTALIATNPIETECTISFQESNDDSYTNERE